MPSPLQGSPRNLQTVFTMQAFLHPCLCSTPGIPQPPLSPAPSPVQPKLPLSGLPAPGDPDSFSLALQVHVLRELLQLRDLRSVCFLELLHRAGPFPPPVCHLPFSSHFQRGLGSRFMLWPLPPVPLHQCPSHLLSQGQCGGRAWKHVAPPWMGVVSVGSSQGGVWGADLCPSLVLLITNGELYPPSSPPPLSPGCATSHGVVQVQDTSGILEEVSWTLTAVAHGWGSVSSDRGMVGPASWHVPRAFWVPGAPVGIRHVGTCLEFIPYTLHGSRAAWDVSWCDSGPRRLAALLEARFTQISTIAIQNLIWHVFKNKMVIRGQNSQGSLSGGGSINQTLLQEEGRECAFDPRGQAPA